MRAGGRNRRVTIQGITDGKDGAGGPTETATDLFTRIPASIRPMGGQQRFAGQQVDAGRTVEIMILPDSRFTLTPKHRLRDEVDGTVYDVQAVMDVDKRNRKIRVLATTRV